MGPERRRRAKRDDRSRVGSCRLKYSICIIEKYKNSPFIEKIIANSNAIRFQRRETKLFVEHLLRQLDIIVDRFRRCCRDRFSLGYKGDPKVALRTRAMQREKITPHRSRVGDTRDEVGS